MNDGRAHNDCARASTLRFLSVLTFLTNGEAIGRPFGSGTGLEDAVAEVRNSFTSIGEAREGGLWLATSIVAATSIVPDDVNAVMGVDSLDRPGLTKDQAEAARTLAVAAVAFLDEVNQDGATFWELWRNSNEIAEEFLCWHAVAWGRLTTLGKAPHL